MKIESVSKDKHNDERNEEIQKRTEGQKNKGDNSVKISKDIVRIGCAIIVFYGVLEGYNRFSQRYDSEVVESSIHQVFTVAEALGHVVISYCLARGIMILFNVGDK